MTAEGGEPAEPAGLYLHVPFCSAICPYCDFAVRVGRREKRQLFVDTLLLEIARSEPVAQPFAAVDTVYFGGGTPSLLEPEDLARLLDAIGRTFRPDARARLYLEANPEDVDEASLEAWRRLGVDVLTLGVQSFDDDELRFLGRRHDGAAARRATELALAAGFTTVSIDLIFGLPGRSVETLRDNLLRAAALGPDHLSCYELEIHQRTTFGKRRARGELEELPGDEQAELFLLSHRILADAGYDGYEVSNFARAPKHRSRHNRKYWHHVPYLGLGPSAHSFDGRRRRWWNHRHLPRWERALRAGQTAEAGSEILEARDLALETIMLALRTTEGIDLADFERCFGVDLVETNRALVERSVASGLLGHDRGQLVPTLEGMAVADGLAGAFKIGRAGRHDPRCDPPPGARGPSGSGS